MVRYLARTSFPNFTSVSSHHPQQQNERPHYSQMTQSSRLKRFVDASCIANVATNGESAKNHDCKSTHCIKTHSTQAKSLGSSGILPELYQKSTLFICQPKNRPDALSSPNPSPPLVKFTENLPLPTTCPAFVQRIIAKIPFPLNQVKP